MTSLSNTDFDSDAYKKTTKALYIIFIILIVLCNGVLIFRIWSQKQFFYSAKYLLLGSLSIGDIFLAIYSLVISTREVFDDFSPGELSCSLFFTAYVYKYFLLNFVHGIGLALLSAEYIHRCRSNRQRTKTPTDILSGLAISCAPWMLGLVIILPLSMVGMDYVNDTCGVPFSISREQATCIMSTIVPAVIAVVAAICASCIKQDHVTQQQIELTPQQNQVFSNQSTQMDTQGAPVIDGYNKQPEMAPQNNYPPQTAPQLKNPQQYPPPSYMGPPAYDIIYPPAINSTQVNNSVIGLKTNPQITTAPLVINYEKNKILSLALLFFFLVTPQEIFYLVYNLNILITDGEVLSEVAYTAIADGLYWLMLLRSIFTPLIAITPSFLQHA